MLVLRSRSQSTRALLRTLTLGAGLVAAAASLTPSVASAQWSRVFEQFYFPDESNWAFRHNYPAADLLFNAFDYGHAILYEKLYTKPRADPSILEEKEYNFITRELLVHPPRVPLEEGAIEVAYAKLAPEAKAMFDWAHVLHRQIYDVWADEGIPPVEKDARIAKLLTYYKTRRDLAFSSIPKSMELMEGQPYSRFFRERYPKFNGLIWAYHWLQVGLYEPLLVGKDKDERQTGVIAAVARFRQMIEDPPENMPRLMPMTAAVAPTFARRYPEAAIIFDNLHSMHDVVSDILANPQVPRDKKRAEILRAAARYRDATSYAMTLPEWMEMAQMMGVENMGGPAVNFLSDFPKPTVARGAPATEAMQHMAGMQSMPGMAGADSTKAGAQGMGGMDHSKMGNMPGMTAGRDSAQMTGDMAGMKHPAAGDSAAGMLESRMGAMQSAMSAEMMDMHMRMLADPVIRKRMLADTAMHRMMTDMVSQMPAEHREMMTQMMKEGSAPTTTTARPASRVRKSPTARPAAKRTAPAMPAGHEGMNMPGMNVPTAKPKAAAPKKPAAKKRAPKPAKDSMPAMDHSKMKMPKP